MILEGDTSVIDAIKAKKHLMDLGEPHDHIRPLLVCGGGASKGVYALGALQAMAALGYQNCFHTVVGISVGALTASYFVADELDTVEALPGDRTFVRRFLSIWRPFHVLDTHYLRSIVEHDTRYKLSTDNIYTSPINFQVGLSKFETATPVLFSPDNDDDLFESLRATVSMAGAVSDPVYIHGERYLDGSTTQPYIRTKVYEHSEATHILDLTNQELGAASYNVGEAILIHTLYRAVTNKAVREAANQRRCARKAAIHKALKEQRVPLCVVWGDRSVGTLDRSVRRLAKTTERSKQFWLRLLAK